MPWIPPTKPIERPPFAVADEPAISTTAPEPDDPLDALVGRLSLAVVAIAHLERRRAFLAEVHDRLVADMLAWGLDRDLALVRADLVIEAVVEAVAAGRSEVCLSGDRLERQAGASP